jgi:hypothetical protein
VRADEAVADDGASRWDNFYVEANRFLLQSPGTDGVYLDAVAFDRTTMERIRKNMERIKDNVRVDIHRSGGWYCRGPGYGTPALRYMQVGCTLLFICCADVAHCSDSEVVLAL